MSDVSSSIIKEFTSREIYDEGIIRSKDAKWPKISIITPSYNQAEFIERTILSVLNQNYPNFEFIIIDGDSTDGSVDLIGKYERFLDVFVSEKDRGQTHALNKGFKKCTGALVCWMNSDDIFLPNVFHSIAEIFIKEPEYDIYYANKINIDAKDRLLRKVAYVRPLRSYMEYYVKHRGMPFSNQSAFFKPSVFSEVGEFDESFNICMDRDYFYRCLKAGKKFLFCDDVWGAWRDHAAAKTSSGAKVHTERLREKEWFASKHGIYYGFWHGFLSIIGGLYRRILLASQ